MSYTPLLSTVDKIKVQQVQCSTLNTDLTKCQEQLDVLDPQGKRDRLQKHYTESMSNMAETIEYMVEKDKKSINESINRLDKVLPSNRSLEKQVMELTAQKKALDTEKQNLEQSIRAHRRRFLDNDPQEGTPAILGLRTSDDKVLLFFWIALLIVVNLGIFAYFAILKRSHIPIVYIGATVGVFAIAYIVLYNATRIEYKVRSTTL